MHFILICGRYNSGYAAGRYHTLLELNKIDKSTQARMASNTLEQEELNSATGPTQYGYTANDNDVGITWNKEELNTMVNDDMEEGKI